MAESVDAFFVDGYEVRYDDATLELVVVMTMNHFGSCYITRPATRRPEEFVESLVQAGNDHLERLSTEAASLGQLPAWSRPVDLPEGVTLEFRPVGGNC